MSERLTTIKELLEENGVDIKDIKETKNSWIITSVLKKNKEEM